ncbi:hypothetical protein HAP47_0022600 [Bradyrhizobium sp. 41S5]|uniref:hypothetical protein n=1 Tax=Bradyrhizobium sp. 41S5 TaxID=1404443 RepID=UPI00156B4AF3|nr:hypothetical protein [Bradyrhizobium sp. 41S5]UFX42055.1 hypothetical protein HAP47_0022600 [Bradyrhizobium sp. 41S5]
MTRRFHAGYNSFLGAYGVWLSRPGVDVLATSSNSDFLLRAETKNDQIVMSGSIYLPIGSGDQSIPYPATFTKTPYVWFEAYIDSGVVAYPYNQGMAGHDLTIGGVLTYEVGMGLRFMNDKITLNNQSDTYNFYVDYMIFHRSLGL